jgi:hypothetical protein
MITDPATASLRNNLFAAAAGVPGTADWLADKLSQLDIAYPATQPHDTMAGRRIDPRIAAPRGVSWTVITPPGAEVVGTPDDVTVTTSGAVDEPIAVRPDGVAADRALTAEALGIDISSAGRPATQPG